GFVERIDQKQRSLALRDLARALFEQIEQRIAVLSRSSRKASVLEPERLDQLGAQAAMADLRRIAAGAALIEEIDRVRALGHLGDERGLADSGVAADHEVARLFAPPRGIDLLEQPPAADKTSGAVADQRGRSYDLPPDRFGCAAGIDSGREQEAVLRARIERRDCPRDQGTAR